MVLKAMGRAINKTVGIAEIVKRRVHGLHQITDTGSAEIVDVWEPKEPGRLTDADLLRHASLLYCGMPHIRMLHSLASFAAQAIHLVAGLFEARA